jgi:hypothetical protein
LTDIYRSEIIVFVAITFARMISLKCSKLQIVAVKAIIIGIFSTIFALVMTKQANLLFHSLEIMLDANAFSIYQFTMKLPKIACGTICF